MSGYILKTMSTHHCSWITHEKLVEIAEKRFSTVIQEYQKGKFSDKAKNYEPTLTIVQSLLMEMDVQEVHRSYESVALTKTLQNAIGLFHQDVLGAAPNWINTGSSGGSFDIRSSDPISLADNKKVLAEVKMRYNTIKGSDKASVFDKLRHAYISNGKEEHISYLIEIIPHKNEAYDRPWKVSNRVLDNSVRHVDGVSAYHLVTGDPEGLKNLYLDLPHVFSEAVENITQEKRIMKITDAVIEELIGVTLPPQSIYSIS